MGFAADPHLSIMSAKRGIHETRRFRLALRRALGQKLAETWLQQVVIENRPGAGGNIAAGTPRDFADYIAREIPKWAKVVKDSGARAE